MNLVVRKAMWRGALALAAAAVLVLFAGTLRAQGTAQTSAGSVKPAQAAVSGNAKRGEYLVKAVGCNDCHTPEKMGKDGPEPDMSRMLSGHPSDLKLPAAPAASGPWITSVAASTTAWAGPWGVSYTANLTPDPETGLGQWTEDQFLQTIRNGRHQGRGRELLPPMPWQAFRNFSDEDLKAIFAYLHSIPAIKNKVPDPIVAAPGRP